ncbi:MAG: energy transducer TonB [Bryobacteraceae bacterium]
MPSHAHIFDDEPSIRRPLLVSVGLHALLAAAAVLSAAFGGGPLVQWGAADSLGGGSVGINVVKQVPLPSRGGPVNPVARDTESAVPQQPAPPKPAPAPKPEPVEDPDAVAIKGQASKKREVSGRKTAEPPAPNQVYSSSGAALSSPMVGAKGSGGVGIGSGSPFGNRFGAYVDLLRQRVAEKWRTADVDPRLQTAPPVIVTFTIMRTGQIRDVRIVQRSGNGVLDLSSQRAVYEAAPFPPLPAGFDRDSATIEFWFELKR